MADRAGPRTGIVTGPGLSKCGPESASCPPRTCARKPADGGDRPEEAHRHALARQEPWGKEVDLADDFAPAAGEGSECRDGGDDGAADGAQWQTEPVTEAGTG